MKRFTIGKKIVSASSAVALISYFLPWYDRFLDGKTYRWSGLKFLQHGINNNFWRRYGVFSVESIPMTTLIILILSLVSIGLCIPYYLKRQNQINKSIPIAQIFCGLFGFLPFYLIQNILLWEWHNWRGIDLEMNILIWVNILSQIGIVIGAILILISLGDGKQKERNV
jgi:hypothetical protein